MEIPEDTIKKEFPQPLSGSREAVSQKVSILLTDILGAAAFYKDHSNLAGRIILQKNNDLLLPLIKEHSGAIVKAGGDSILAYFLLPAQALSASIAIQKALAAYNLSATPDAQLLTRIAVSYGGCIIEEHDVTGEAVNAAGKILSCCEALQIIIEDAFYNEIKNAPGVTITPLALKKETGGLITFPVYAVAEETAPEAAEPVICFLSLSAKRNSDGTASSGGVKKITTRVRQDAYRVINSDEAWLHAIFETPQVCLETAAAAMQEYLGCLSEGEAQAHYAKIGLHLITEKYSYDNNFQEYFNEAEAACECAGSGDIIITGPFYQHLPPEFKKNCRLAQKLSADQKKLYIFQQNLTGRTASALTFFIPDGVINPDEVACFYCGMTLHPACSCPSKLIRESLNAAEKLSYAPLSQIRKLFDENFLDYVKPLQAEANEARYERLFGADRAERNDLYAAGFFSFYEISGVFQLRSIHQLYLDHPPQHVSTAGNTGALAVGRDCFRVSRSNEAHEWFNKALRENPNDYRCYIDMALLSMEAAEPSRAIASLRKAFSCATKDEQKNYISLIIARIYEISGALISAKEEMQKVLNTSPSWSQGLYYYAVLLAKMKNAGAAIDIFKKLLESSDRYYLLIFLDPELQGIRKELNAFLGRMLAAMRAKAQESFEAMKQVAEDFKIWFSRSDEEYKAAAGIFQKASQHMKDECISGLLDLPGLESDVTLLFRHALDKRRNELEDKLAQHRKIYEAYAACLAHFPYQSAIGPGDRALKNDFKTYLENARKNISAASPEKLRDARAIITALTEKADEAVSSQRRLEMLKNLYFALDCLWKIICFFVITGLAATFIVTLSLALYNGIMSSFGSITVADIMSYLQYGFITGFFSGLLGTGIWFKINFRELYRKLEL